MKYMFKNGEGNAERISPILIEKAVGFFLESQMMGDIVQGYEIKKEPISHGLRTDFVASDTCVEMKVLMTNGMQKGAGLGILRHLLVSNKRNVLQEHYKRVVLLVICEEDMYEQVKASFLSKGSGKSLEEELDHGVKVWISGIRIEKDGIELVSYQKVAPSV